MKNKFLYAIIFILCILLFNSQRKVMVLNNYPTFNTVDHNEVIKVKINEDIHIDSVLDLLKTANFDSVTLEEVDTTSTGIKEGYIHVTKAKNTVTTRFTYEVIED